VLNNLLGNAWKFTAKRAQAEITFGGEQKNGENTYFIRDNGAGFDMAYVGKLFGAFQRLHTAVNSRAQVSVWPQYSGSSTGMEGASGPKGRWMRARRSISHSQIPRKTGDEPQSESYWLKTIREMRR